MAWIHVCPLAYIGAVVEASGASHVLSLLSGPEPMPTLAHLGARHLRLTLSDIAAPRPGHVLAAAAQVEDLVGFVRGWDRSHSLLIHCYAGVSRSTAAAFVAWCALAPERAEADLAMALRRASPSATPNLHLVALADALLERDGRMVAAVAAIGRGVDCFEGNVFALEVPDKPSTGVTLDHTP